LKEFIKAFLNQDLLKWIANNLFLAFYFFIFDKYLFPKLFLFLNIVLPLNSFCSFAYPFPPLLICRTARLVL